MKKFKNIRLMLLGLLAAGSMNAFAAVGDFKTDGTYWYKVLDEAKATVALVGYSNVADANPTSLTIKEKVPLKDDQLKDKEYTVATVMNISGVNRDWWNKPTGNEYVQKVDVTKVKELIFKIRIDGGATTDDTSVDNEWMDIVKPALDVFTNIEKLVVEKAFMISQLPALNTFASLKNIDFGGVANGGSAIKLADNFVNGLTLESLTLPTEQLVVGNSAFAYVNHGADAALTVDLSNVVYFDDWALFDANIPTVTIGADVTNIGDYAFESDLGSKSYLTTVVWKSNKLLDTNDPKLPYIPAKFKGQQNISSITINAVNIDHIADGAFASITGEVAVDLGNEETGAIALKGIKNAFGTGAAAPKYTKLLLAAAPLKATSGKVSDIVDLTNSKSSLTELTLPSTVTAMDKGEFASFTALEAIGLDMEIIPEDAFKGASALKTLDLGDNVATIGKSAFENTNLTAINIPVGVTSIGASAFAGIRPLGDDKKPVAVPLTFAAGSKLNSIGESAFEESNIGSSSSVNLNGTAVKAIAKNAFKNTQSVNFLTSVTLNAETASIAESAFEGNAALATVDNLNQDKMTAIGKNAFKGTALPEVNLASTGVKAIAEGAFSYIRDLKTVTLNAETTEIGKDAFAKDHQLDKVENLGQGKLTKINDGAFAESALTELNLADATSLTTIGVEAFSAGKSYNEKTKDWDIYNPTLTSVTFPSDEGVDPASKEGDDNKFAKKYKNQIQTIGAGAFLHQKKLATLANFKYTKITTLPEMFTNVYSVSGANITHSASDFVKDEDQTAYCPADLKLELPNVTFEVVEGKDWDEYKYTVFAWESSDASAISLTTINNYALQGLGLEDIVIPATVTTFGGCVLQGNTDLKNVVWMDANPTPTKLDKYTFRGDSNLEKFFYMTTGALKSGDLTDMHFYWCSKDKLRVYVTSESLKVLEADGYTTANALYSKLNDTLEDFITFSASGLNSADNMYYRTYFNNHYSTWIEASDDLVVYTAKFDGAKVVMDKAKVEEGYYKIKKYNSTDAAYATAIIASATDKVKVEYYAIDGNNKSTLDGKNNELKVNYGTTPKAASKLSYFFKLGKGPQGIGFYRITTGEFKPNAVYLQAADAARDFYGISGEETGIKAIEQMVEDDAPVYNLQGVRVNAAQKGMFIKNGKKFIVK